MTTQPIQPILSESSCLESLVIHLIFNLNLIEESIASRHLEFTLFVGPIFKGFFAFTNENTHNRCF